MKPYTIGFIPRYAEGMEWARMAVGNAGFDVTDERRPFPCHFAIWLRNPFWQNPKLPDTVIDPRRTILFTGFVPDEYRKYFLGAFPALEPGNKKSFQRFLKNLTGAIRIGPPKIKVPVLVASHDLGWITTTVGRLEATGEFEAVTSYYPSQPIFAGLAGPDETHADAVPPEVRPISFPQFPTDSPRGYAKPEVIASLLRSTNPHRFASIYLYDTRQNEPPDIVGHFMGLLAEMHLPLPALNTRGRADVQQIDRVKPHSLF